MLIAGSFFIVYSYYTYHMNKSSKLLYALSLFVIVFSLAPQFAFAKTVTRGTPVTLNLHINNVVAPFSCNGATSSIYPDYAWETPHTVDANGNSAPATWTPTTVGTWTFTCTHLSGSVGSDTLTVQDCGGSLSPGTVWSNGTCVTTLSCTPTASLTIDGAHSATLTPGQSNTKSWSSTGGTSWSSSYSFSGSCANAGASGAWSANTSDGSVTNTANGGNDGCTAAITYTVTNSSCVASPSASDTISVTTACPTGTSWNGSTCATVTTPSGSITPNSCTISAGAGSCAMNVAWSSSNTTGTVTVQRGYSPYGTIASGTSDTQSFTFPPGTYTLNLLDGTTPLGSANFTASCAADSTWNGSTCYVAPGAISASITASPTSLPAGGGTTGLTWSSSGATSCTRSGVLGIYGAVPTSGSATTNPFTTTTTFNLDCVNASGVHAYSSATVTVGSVQTPSCTNGATNPPDCNNVCTNGYSNYPTCGPVCTTSACTSATNSCGQTNSGTISSCGGGCSASAPADPAVSASVSAWPNRVEIGGTLTVSWITSGANACTITKNGATWKTVSNSSCALSSSASDTVTTQTKYGITCTNATYSASATSNFVNVVPLFQEF